MPYIPPILSINMSNQITIPKKFRPFKSVEKEIKTFPEIEVEHYYIENFFTKKEADEYFKILLQDHPFRQEQSYFMGNNYDQPRLTRIMSNEQSTYYYSGYNRDSVEWIPSVLNIRDKVMETVIKLRPDHPLFTASIGNLYRTGKDYIAWHSDTETDLSSDAMIASISLGSERDFDIRRKGETSKCIRVNLKHGSLFLMGRGFQKKYEHHLPKRLKIIEPRINLTLRVLKPNSKE